MGTIGREGGVQMVGRRTASRAWQRLLLLIATLLIAPLEARSSAAATASAGSPEVPPNGRTGDAAPPSTNEAAPETTCTKFVLPGDPKGTELDELVRSDGKATLSFECVDATAPTRVQVRILPFRSSAGQVLDVGFPPSQFGRSVTEREVSLKAGERVLVLELAVGAMPVAGEYEGGVALLPEGARQVTFTVKLSAAKPAGYLVVDTPSVRFDGVLPFLGDPPSTSIVLRDRGGGTALTDLRVRPVGDDSTFNAVDHVCFRDEEGKPLPWLWADPLNPKDADSFPNPNPNAKDLKLDLSLHDVAPGEYRFELQFESPNSRVGPDQKVTVVARLRRPWWSAAVVVLLGVVCSLSAGQLLANRKAAIEIARTLDGLRRDWLGELPPLPAVVWLRATRRLCRDLVRGGRSLLVPAKEALAEPLERATLLTSLLYEYLLALRALRTQNAPYMRDYHTRRRLNELISGLEPYELRKETADKTRSELVRLREEVEKDTTKAKSKETIVHYRKLFLVDQFQGLIAEDAKPQLEKLCTQLNKGDADKFDADAFERIEAVIKILLDRRADVLSSPPRPEQDDLTKLIQALPAALPLNDVALKDFFQVADGQTWNRLVKEQDNERRLYLYPCLETLANKDAKPMDPPEAYRPFSLRVEAKDPDLNADFVLKSRVECVWTFELQEKRGPLRRAWKHLPWNTAADVPLAWKERSKGNQIVQFAPAAGTLVVTVQMSLDGRQSEPLSGTLKIDKARELSLISSVQGAEWVTTIITLLIAGLTGLSTQYFGNFTFGAFKDYLALFTWAAALDATKSVIQGLSTTAPTQAAPALAPGASKKQAAE